MKCYRVLCHTYRFSSVVAAHLGLPRVLLGRKRGERAVEGTGLYTRLGLALRPRLSALVPDPFEVDGLRFYRFPGHLFAMDMALGKYEVETTQAVSWLLRPGMTFVDVGANIGWYSVLAARLVGTEGRVYAFEPDTRTAGILRQNVTTNGFEATVRISQQAVSSRPGVVRLFCGQDRATNSMHPTKWTSSQHVDVPATTLDDFFEAEGWPPVHLVKMDIEGAEAEAMKGMAETRRRNPEMKLIMEFIPLHIRAAGGTPEGVLALLNDLGFARLSLLSDHMRPLQLPGDIPLLARWTDVRGTILNLLCENA